MTKKGKGIKRHESLYPLSHHHQNGLAVALHLKRAETEESTFTVEETKFKLQRYWENGGSEHFRDEEELLLPAYARYASLAQPEISEMLVEHVQIRALVQQVLETDAGAEDMHRLGKLWEQHIRKEERVIFPMLEKALPEDTLEKLHPHFHRMDPPSEGVFYDPL
ncbi:hemerythrin domain-containing protein [Salicibibacter halophilus]|uniref:Hemerythrin domain-containing protein n=1 Tax=Salicibibacter halophilus TaxID=2502791 RepID=A0A514LM55_9BACI|nr:hemerythrin domain-containing protein [Salicibibacter halophilus]QDI92615.1 hemerythrin domain-containing protein [Salicibibacter halophilus]